MNKLHIDIETYSSEDLSSAGVYRYAASADFEILMIAYAINYGPVKIVDLARGEAMPQELIDALTDRYTLKLAHNAAFERICLSQYGFTVPTEEWHCTAVKASYCGLPRSLGEVSSVLKLGDGGKDAAGKALIRYFSIPVKPTKANGMRTRNLPSHDPEKWDAFKRYCMKDVDAEREIDSRLLAYELPVEEWELYVLDQEINDRGVRIDLDLVRSAISMDQLNAAMLIEEMKEITGCANPNSADQLKKWLKEKIGYEGVLDKEAVESLLKKKQPAEVSRLLDLRSQAARSAIKKYTAMTSCVTEDQRIHGLFLFYGAARTGRWSGRLVQLQNLYRNHLEDLDLARKLVKNGDATMLDCVYGDVSSVLAQLIRTALIASPGKTLSVADFSAIEARVIAWLAGEQWRLDVFQTHGKIYEASAAMMFGVPIESITKGSDLRQKGKVAELALGYQGGSGALKTMGGEKMGLSESDMKDIVVRWRSANPKIVSLWTKLDNAAKNACRNKGVEYEAAGLKFKHDKYALMITLPSGRKLFYKGADIGEGRYGTVIKYEGVDQDTKKWTVLETYGGKITENVVQAIARDLLSFAMLNLSYAGFQMTMHIHDEVVAETNDDPRVLEYMCEIMGQDVPWAPGLPLRADGYQTEYYKKD